MADEPKQAQAPSGAPRREGGSGGHGGPGGGHGGPGGPRREGGPGGPGGGPGGPRRGKRQYFRKKKVCKFCVEKMDFIDYKRADILSQFVQERGKILPRRMTASPAPSNRTRRGPSGNAGHRAACSSGPGSPSASANRSAQDLSFWSAGVLLPLLRCKHRSIFKRSTATAATPHVAAADFRGRR